MHQLRGVFCLFLFCALSWNQVPPERFYSYLNSDFTSCLFTIGFMGCVSLFIRIILLSMLTRSQILRALRSAARQLGRTPTRAEFLRLTGIHPGRVVPHFPGGYRAAVRAAGLSPDPGGLRIGTAALLTDWARLARKKGRIPTREEYD